MSCQRLNIGFSPSSPDNNDKTDLYNNYFMKNVPPDNRVKYYDILKSKEFIENDNNMSLMAPENYKLLLDLTGYDNNIIENKISTDSNKKEKFSSEMTDKIIGLTDGLKLSSNFVLSENIGRKPIKKKKGDNIYLFVLIIISIIIITLFNTLK